MSDQTCVNWQLRVALEPTHFDDLPIGTSFILALEWDDWGRKQAWERRHLYPLISVKLSDTDIISVGLVGAKPRPYAAANIKDDPNNIGLHKDCYVVRHW